MRNYDLDPKLSEATVLRSAWTGRNVVATMEAIAGAADGVNAAGLAVSLAFGGRKERGTGFGVPLIVRYLLEVASDTRDAVAVLRRIPCHMSYNLTLVDRNGDAATAFLAPDRPAEVIRRPFATNHQARVDWPEQARFSRTVERAGGHRAAAGDARHDARPADRGVPAFAPLRNPTCPGLRHGLYRRLSSCSCQPRAALAGTGTLASVVRPFQ